MKLHLVLLVWILTSIPILTAQPRIESLGTFDKFQIKPYLEQTIILQCMDRQKAIAQLTEWAAERKHEDQVVILCRMLFTGKPNEKFRRPMIGGAAFLGKTNYSDWPLEPITIYQGIPILITRGYILAGYAEPSLNYLRYCQTECQWNDFPFLSLADSEISERLQKFIDSYPWKQSIEKWDRDFLLNQANPQK
jgi:hypothetical protein